MTGATKSGVALVATTTTTSWATAVLEIRLAADEVSPKTRAATTAFVAVLADAGARVLGSSGRVQARVGADSIAVAFGATADQPDLPARAVDAALRALKTTKPTTVVSPPALDVVDDDLDVAAAAWLLPPTAAGLAVDGAAIDAAAFRALADTVRVDRVAVALVGPGSAEDVLARGMRAIGAPLAKAVTAAVVAGVDDTRSILIERRDPGSTSSTSTIAWWAKTPSTVTERAAVIVLAELLGGRIARSADRIGIVVTVTAADRGALIAVETARAQQLAKLSSAAPTVAQVTTATTTALRARQARLDDPTRLAYALGRGLLDGDDVSTNALAELAAISDVTAAAVTAAASRLNSGLQLVQRGSPTAVAVAPALLKKTTTTTTTTTTTPARR